MEDEISTNYLPIANIKKIVKSSFEDKSECKLSKDAIDTYLEILNEFIAFIVSDTHEAAIKNNRKTITGADLIKSLDKLGFDHYTDILKKLLEKHNQQTDEKSHKD